MIYILYKNNDDNFYLGKTNNVYNRILHHKHCCKVNLDRKVYNYINENGGFEEWEYKIISSDDEDTESKWYHILKPTLNKNICGRAHKEWYQENKDYHKNWRLQNPGYFAERYRQQKEMKKKHIGDYTILRVLNNLDIKILM